MKETFSIQWVRARPYSSKREEMETRLKLNLTKVQLSYIPWTQPIDTFQQWETQIEFRTERRWICKIAEDFHLRIWDVWMPRKFIQGSSWQNWTEGSLWCQEIISLYWNVSRFSGLGKRVFTLIPKGQFKSSCHVNVRTRWMERNDYTTPRWAFVNFTSSRLSTRTKPSSNCQDHLQSWIFSFLELLFHLKLMKFWFCFPILPL